jgi:hypothetical protein
MFERKTEKLLPFPRFLGRVTLSFALAAGIVGIALAIGIVGYHAIARLGWIDAILNASMILTGMGPVATMNTNAAKLFASAYALFSGVVFLSAMGIVLSPMFHRVLHVFHLDDADENPPSTVKGSRKGRPAPENIS